ncbi:heparan sulfate glucosamine 3-O-sulfotransferase 1-like [Convolutriloba macropyga]|uniref:heparan sulfate glucosamine 3-O-sulfotransferase 1-like n=1 Tax=Convolutriloba macropyga TaxID=536237 RepID=UPI003F521D38
MSTQAPQIPVKHMLCFLLTVFVCSFVFAYQYIENSNYCLSTSYIMPYPESTAKVQSSLNPRFDTSISRSPIYTNLSHEHYNKSDDAVTSKMNNRIEKSNSFWKAAEFRGCCLPNTIIIGAKKAGTRALINFLKIHPEVAIAPNEVHFFDREENYSRGLKWYAKKIESQDAKVLIEKSPYYFIDYNTPERVQAYNSSIKLILLARNPVKRVLSDQTQLFHNSGGTTPTLEEKLFTYDNTTVDKTAKVLQPSLYVKYLTHWLQWFPKSQIHIVDGDKLVRENPFYEMKPLEKFLQLSSFFNLDKFQFSSTKGFFCPVLSNNDLKCLGSTKGTKHLRFYNSTIYKLTEFFQPYNEQFYTLVGKDFGWT